MLPELSTALDNYYRSPSCKKRKPRNLILVPIDNYNNINDIYESENIPPNRILNNYNIYNNFIPKTPNYMPIPNFNYNNNSIITPSSHHNQNINYLYNNQNLNNNKIGINNYNNNINKRSKSAIKTRKTQNIKTNNDTNDINDNYSFNTRYYNDNSKSPINNKIRKKNNKISLIKNKQLGNGNDIIEDDYDFNYNMNQFENVINSINLNGFQKFQDEINNKNLLIAQLKNSIAILKNKIYLCKSNLYDGIRKEEKNKIKYENMLSVSNRYKNIGQTADNYKNDINNFQNKINMINNETLQLKKISLNEQNYIDIMNEEIRKGNKSISDKKKEMENILPALQLLKNHIASIKQKITQLNNVKNNYIEKLNYIENDIY